jgi:hypothetical protein
MTKKYWGGTSSKKIDDSSQVAVEYLSVFRSIALKKVSEITGLQEMRVESILNDLLEAGYIEGECKEGIFHRDLIITKKKKEVLLRLVDANNKILLTNVAQASRLSERQTRELIDGFLRDGVIKGKWDNETFINFAVESGPSREIEVKREYDYVGGRIRFKIVVRNLTQEAISKITVTLNISEQFSIDEPMQTVTALMPGEARGIDYMLSPLTCGTSNVFGTVSYTDPFGEVHSITIKPKDINIKCPLVVPIEATRKEIDEWRRSLLKGASSLPISGLPRLQAFKIVCDQVAALDLKQIEFDEHQMMSTYSGIAKVTGNKIIVAIRVVGDEIKLILWTRDLKEATGFIAYIKNLIKVAIDVTKKLRVGVEKIGQKIVDSFAIIERLFQLAKSCEIQDISHEILLILKEIKLKIEMSFEELPIIELIDKWELEITTQFEEEEPINEFVAANIFYDTLNWIKEISKVAEANVTLYSDTFKDDIDAIQQSNDKKKEIKNKLIEFEEIYSRFILKYLMVINKVNGILMYSQACSNLEFDGDLVSGFLTAIGTFGAELTKKETTMRAIQYQEFEIELGGGEYIRAAVVLSGKITEFLRKKLRIFVKKFEIAYEDYLKIWVGDVSVFNEAEYIVYSVFGVSSDELPTQPKKNQEE